MRHIAHEPVFYQTMEIIEPSQGHEDLVFLYQVYAPAILGRVVLIVQALQLVPGCSAFSYASRIALLAGVARSIVDRGIEISKALSVGEEVQRRELPGFKQRLQEAQVIVSKVCTFVIRCC